MHASLPPFLTSLGWIEFLQLNCDVYIPLVRKFYTTITLVPDDASTVRCRMFGIEYQFDIKTLAQVVNLPNAGVVHAPACFDHDRVWNELTGKSQFDYHSAYTSSITDPLLSIVHKLLCLQIFGLKEANKLSSTHLLCLWCIQK